MSKTIKNIKVFNDRGKKLAPTSYKVAKMLVAREKAIWIDEGKSLTLLYTKTDFKKMKKKIIEEEGRLCYICGREIPESENATIDHIIPKSKFGKDCRKNLRCCCKRCNDDKGDMRFILYYDQIISNRDKYAYINFDLLKKTKQELSNKERDNGHSNRCNTNV